MTGHATLPCEVCIFIFDNDWARLVNAKLAC